MCVGFGDVFCETLGVYCVQVQGCIFGGFGDVLCVGLSRTMSSRGCIFGRFGNISCAVFCVGSCI